MADFVDVQDGLMLRRSEILAVEMSSTKVRIHTCLSTPAHGQAKCVDSRPIEPYYFDVWPGDNQTVDDLYQHIRALLGSNSRGYRHDPPSLYASK